MFLDESGVNVGLARHYGRAQGGARAFDDAPVNRPATTTVEAAVGPGGPLGAATWRGGMTKEKFLSWMRSVLAPLPRGERVRDPGALPGAMVRTLARATPSDCARWYRPCGYAAP